MHTVGIGEAEAQFGALLHEVERGGMVLITRDGRPVARLVSAQAQGDRADARRAAEQLRAASRGLTLCGVSLRELITEGRR